MRTLTRRDPAAEPVTDPEATREAALKLLDRHPVPLDLVLTDVLMPRMNGRQLGDALHARHPDLPVLYMSGDIGEGNAARHLVPEGAPFLRKPFSPSQLMEHITAVLA